jgi:hypothetical protein
MKKTDAMSETELNARHSVHSRKVGTGFRPRMRAEKTSAWRMARRDIRL